jgi:integrase
VAIGVYLIPTWVALIRHHTQAAAIFAINLGPVRRDRLSGAWTAAKDKVRANHDPDLDVDLHLHDLRHHALTLSARKPGITTKELMARGGHSTSDVALRYQHAASRRDHEVANFMDDLIAGATDDQAEADIVALHR